MTRNREAYSYEKQPPRVPSNDRASRNKDAYGSNFNNSREIIDRSKSFERRANESGHSAYMRNMESGPNEIRYTGQSLSMSENKGFVKSEYPKSTN